GEVRAGGQQALSDRALARRRNKAIVRGKLRFPTLRKRVGPPGGVGVRALRGLLLLRPGRGGRFGGGQAPEETEAFEGAFVAALDLAFVPADAQQQGRDGEHLVGRKLA